MNQFLHGGRHPFITGAKLKNLDFWRRRIFDPAPGHDYQVVIDPRAGILCCGTWDELHHVISFHAWSGLRVGDCTVAAVAYNDRGICRTAYNMGGCGWLNATSTDHSMPIIA